MTDGSSQGSSSACGGNATTRGAWWALSMWTPGMGGSVAGIRCAVGANESA